MAIALAGQQVGQQQAALAALPDAPQQQQQQQQQVPDAPKPQLTGVGPIAPGKGTTPTFNGTPVPSSASALPPDTNQPDLDNPPPATRTMPDEEQGAPPIIAHGTDVFQLPSLRVNSVEIPFTVKDNKGKPVPGIDWREVQVYENGVRQKMQVYTVDPYPLSVALVIDNSMEYHDMERVNNALGALQAAFSNYDSVSVFTYNNGPKMISDMTGGQSARLTAAIERSKSSGRDQMYYAPGEALEQGIVLNGGANQNEVLTGHQPGSPQGVGSAQVQREAHTLNDAILAAAQTVAKAPKGRRRVVYVISDGKEYGSTAKTSQVIKYLQQNKIEVVASLVGGVSVKGMGFVDSLHLPLMMRDNILPVYTKATGGEFYADYRTKGIEESFAKLTQDARTQYTVWYNSREPMMDGKFRKVEVKVLRPNLQVIAKQGYYPSVSDAQPSRVLMTPGTPTGPVAPAGPATSPAAPPQ
jgi:VWFA-related protein